MTESSLITQDEIFSQIAKKALADQRGVRQFRPGVVEAVAAAGLAAASKGMPHAIEAMIKVFQDYEMARN